MFQSNHTSLRRLALIAGSLVLTAGAAPAADLLGLYVGASAGEGRVQSVENSQSDFLMPGPNSKETASHPVYSLFAGIRPSAYFGAEIQHLNFGPADDTASFNTSTVSVNRGDAVFGVAYLPLHAVDLYAKLGVARLRSEDTGTRLVLPSCQPGFACPLFVAFEPYAQSHVNTELAGGLGVSYHLGSWAVRGEYEHFTTQGEHPDVGSIGILKSF